MLLTLPRRQRCLLAAQQKMRKTALLPTASTCRMAQLALTAMASDASMSAVQLQMPASDQDVQSISSQMTASGASCLPPCMLSVICRGIVSGDLSNHQVISDGHV